MFYIERSLTSHDYIFLGTLLYTRTMYVFIGMVEHWSLNNLPIFELLRRSPTFFSEESGEIALSVLTRSRPQNIRADYEQTRRAWLLVKHLHSAAHDADADLNRPPKSKSFRLIGILFRFRLISC